MRKDTSDANDQATPAESQHQHRQARQGRRPERVRVMTGLLSLLASGVLIALGVWLLGGVLLRVGGLLLVATGLLSTATTGSPSTALLTVLGRAEQGDGDLLSYILFDEAFLEQAIQLGIGYARRKVAAGSPWLP